MGDQLEIRTLGGLTITCDGVPVTGLASRKVEALLVYLACTGRQHPREVLAELLWEERSQSQARSNLRVVLTDLRQHLQPFVVITRQAVGLNSASSCWLDTAALQSGIDSAQDHRAREPTLSPTAAANLEKALALYQGDFLAGFYLRDGQAFDQWLSVERERLRQQVVQALQQLVDYFLNQGEYAAGIAQATRCVQIDPFHEAAYHQLMLLLARSGQRNAALAQYETYRCVMTEELGIEPGEPMIALYEQIRAGALESRLSPAAPQHNLPAQPTPFIGRKAELTQLGQYLDDPGCRLLTLTGPGGIGKSRLAIEAASAQLDRFRDGVYFVALASVTAPRLLASAIADALSLGLNSEASPEVQLANYLRNKDMLLVLDNFEHLLEGALPVEQLLGRAPGVKVLVTSRERLNLREEWLFALHGMDVPQDEAPQPVETYSAVQLFDQAARRVKAGFLLATNEAAVIRICKRLDGVPLAIELAASWVKVMPAEHVSGEIERNLDFLQSTLRNVPDRQRSLRASFEHSWQMLTEVDQRVLMGVSVFRGGFNNTAAERVAGGALSVLATLIEKSLLQSNQSGRYTVHEVIRQYAAEKLFEAGGLDAARDRHLDFYTELVEEAAPQLRGQRQSAWLDRIELEHDNVRAALVWALDSEKVRVALRLVSAIWLFWRARGYIGEGRQWLDRVLSANAGEASSLRAAAFHAAGLLSLSQGAFFSAFAYLQESLAIRRAQEDAAGVAATLNGLGRVAWSQGDYTQACVFYEESLAIRQAIGSRLGIASTLNNLGLLTLNQGDHERAQILYKESLALERDLQDKQGIASTLNNMGALATEQGNYGQARISLEESLAIRRELGDKPGIAGSLYNLGMLALDEGDRRRAQDYFHQCLAIRRELEDRAGAADALNRLAGVAMRSGDLDAAYALVTESLSVLRDLGYRRGIALALTTLGEVTLKRGDSVNAYVHLMESLEILYALEDTSNIALCLRELACLSLNQGQIERAARLMGAAEGLREAMGVLHTALDRAAYERDITAFRTALGEEAFSAALAEGRAMSVDQAVAFAGHQGISHDAS
jgi:predicted ATPase/DNA-binding SARP family transcriptional activator/Tfp pilus assembly protein PilF